MQWIFQKYDDWVFQMTLVLKCRINKLLQVDLDDFRAHLELLHYTVSDLKDTWTRVTQHA